MIIKTVKIFPFFFLICTLIFGQSKSNLEIINELVDSSTSKIIAHLDDFQSTYKINLDSPQEYFTLNQKVINSFAEKGLKIDLDSSANTIIYSLVKVGVEYTNLFKDGLLGGYLMERKTTIIGDFSFQKFALISNADKFYFTVTDTINYENYNYVENYSLPFTKGKAPDPPFLPSIFEPFVAITTVVVSVILFFSVRTK